MSNPKLLMLDEPSLGLMPKLVDEMLEAVAKLKESGMTILLVEQNVQHALEISHRGYILENGRVVREGPSSELLHDDQVQASYLGI
jgi:branched-chain amino acid transport system ATP-binding protein